LFEGELKMQISTKQAIAFALFSLWATSAAAVTLTVGQRVKSTTHLDPVCDTQQDAADYSRASDGCGLGGAGCDAADQLEKQGRCGAHYRTYVVLSIDAQGFWMQVSPAKHRSKIYWAATSDFVPVYP
jgi:hypothetical protein